MTPSPPAQAEASETVEQQVARLLPIPDVFTIKSAHGDRHGDAESVRLYVEAHRPIIAAALKSEWDSRDRRIAELKAENAWLRRLIQWCHVRLSKDVYREGLLHMLACGVTTVDDAKLIHSTPGEKS